MIKWIETIDIQELSFNSFPHTILQQTTLKLSMQKTRKSNFMQLKLLNSVENILVKVQIAHSDQFLFLSECLLKLSAADASTYSFWASNMFSKVVCFKCMYAGKGHIFHIYISLLQIFTVRNNVKFAYLIADFRLDN